MAPKPRPPVPNPYSVDYSPTDRAICKGCDGRIAADSVRFLRKVWSPWHDGFDQQKYHLRCGFKFTSHLSEVRGWQALRWEDVMKVVVKFGETIDEKNPVVQKYKKRSSCVWALVDLLKELPKKQLLPILDANEIFYNEVKISALEAALIIADGILFGRFPPCPLCDTRALLQEGCEIRCRGYMPNSSMRCSFRFILDDLLRPSRKPDNSATGVDASSLERKELFILPPEAQRVPSLKGWKPPTDAPEVFKLGNPMSGQKRKVTYDSEGEEEESIPKKKELAGLKFACIGSTNPPRAELAKLIVAHGGSFNENLEKDTDILLVSDDYPTPQVQSSQRFRDAQVAGVAIMRCAFIRGLISRKNVKPKDTLQQAKQELRKAEDPSTVCETRLPKGLLLRQRKYAAYYLVEGQLVKPFPRVADVLKERKEAAALAKSKMNVMRPPIKAGSALLRVDPLFSRKNGKIYVDKLRNAYNASTQFTDISTGINKYYNIQVIQTDKTYHLFTRWGRLGADDKVTNDYRQHSYGSSLKEALAAFEQKFQGLTGLSFADRFDAKQQPGRYAVVELEGYAHDEGEEREMKRMNGGKSTAGGVSTDGERIAKEVVKKEESSHAVTVKREKRKSASSESIAVEKTTLVKTEVEEEEEKEEEDDTPKTGKKTKKMKITTASVVEAKSTIHPAVRKLIKLIFDRDMTTKALKAQHLNLQRMPIESISKRQLNEGYAILQEIQALLQENAEQKTTHKFIVKITDATNRFYNKIPHVFAHSAVPPVIDSLAKLRTKVEMMEQLLDVSVAHSLLDDAMKNARDKHPLDAQYEQLRCRLEPLTKSSEEWELIEKMLLQTHGPTHNTWTLKIQHVYKCEREGEKDQFQKDIGNRMLLWHGSRLTNWASILSQGLKVAPPEAPSSGYMFDKGLYFADMASKSSQYCFATSNSPEAILLLCEVALGKPYIRLEADYEASSHCTSKGLQSLLGVGKSCPNAKDDVEVASGVDGEKVKARTGKCSSNKQAVEEAKKDPDAGSDAALLYNEYVVYDPKQVFMRYLLHVKFEFATFDLDDDDEDSP